MPLRSSDDDPGPDQPPAEDERDVTLDTEPAEAADETSAQPVTPSRSRWLTFGWDNPLAEPVSVAVTSVVLFFVGLGGFSRMRAPLGSGDAIPVYTITKMWAAGGVFGNNFLGYPFGQELRYFPAADITQNAISGLVAAMTHDPFVGLNTLFMLSFPFTALAALWVLRLAGMRGPMAVLASVALTFIPFHWLRTEHIYLASMYSAVLGVGLALAVGSGAVDRALRSEHRVRSALAYAGVVLVIATSGVYYAVFAILFCCVALVVRFARGARLRELVLAATPPALIIVLFGLALVPAVIFERSHPALHAVAKRLVVESVQYSGSLSLALMPAPHSRVPGMGPVNSLVDGALTEGTKAGTSGVLLSSNFGSLFTCLAIVFALVGLVWTSRRQALGARAASGTRDGVSFGLVGALLSTAVLFFVPWGLNFLFAYLVSTQIRAWDRLLPVVYTLVFAAAAVAWRRLGLPSSGWRTTTVAALLGVVLVLDSVAPYRIHFTQVAAAGMAERQAGEAYAEALNAAVPGECGVLQLPVLRYPEEPPQQSLWPLQQFWEALTNPTKKWSSGAMKDTEDSAWLDSLHGEITADTVANLEAGGFCAISVDLRGYTAEEGEQLLAQLTGLLGEPVATGHGGDWVGFALPGAAAGEGTDPSTGLDDMTDDEQVFYAPPVIERTDGSAPERDGAHELWWLGEDPAEFTVRSSEPEADFTSVTLQLNAAACAARSVVVDLTGADGRTSSTTVDLAASDERDVTVTLPSATTDATLRVTPDGQACSVKDDPRDLTVAVQDPVATFR